MGVVSAVSPQTDEPISRNSNVATRSFIRTRFNRQFGDAVVSWAPEIYQEETIMLNHNEEYYCF